MDVVEEDIHDQYGDSEDPGSDDEYGFQFDITEFEYFDVLKSLNALESDLEELETIRLYCPHDGCKRSFSRRHNFLKHLRSHERGINNLGTVCHICGKTIKGLYSIHLKIHENIKQFHCDLCDKSFRQKVALNNHLLIHRNEKPHECPYCFKKFRQKYTMQHHMKNKHTGVKDHICDLCGKEFSDRASLQKHSLVHSTNKPHQCTECFMSFRHKSSLSRHSKRHLKVTVCPICNRSFRYEAFLKKHLLTAHKNDGLETNDTACVEGEIKNENYSQVVQVSGPSMQYAQPMTFTIGQTYSS